MLLLLLLLPLVLSGSAAASAAATAAASCLLQYTWPEFVGADLSKVSLMQALSGTSWDKVSSSAAAVRQQYSRTLLYCSRGAAAMQQSYCGRAKAAVQQWYRSGVLLVASICTGQWQSSMPLQSSFQIMLSETLPKHSSNILWFLYVSHVLHALHAVCMFRMFCMVCMLYMFCMFVLVCMFCMF